MQNHYGWVPYGWANVASYQHLIQIASCFFEFASMLPRDWKNKAVLHIQCAIYSECKHLANTSSRLYFVYFKIMWVHLQFILLFFGLLSCWSLRLTVNPISFIIKFRQEMHICVWYGCYLVGWLGVWLYDRDMTVSISHQHWKEILSLEGPFHPAASSSHGGRLAAAQSCFSSLLTLHESHMLTVLFLFRPQPLDSCNHLKKSCARGKLTQTPEDVIAVIGFSCKHLDFRITDEELCWNAGC